MNILIITLCKQIRSITVICCLIDELSFIKRFCKCCFIICLWSCRINVEMFDKRFIRFILIAFSIYNICLCRINCTLFKSYRNIKSFLIGCHIKVNSVPACKLSAIYSNDCIAVCCTKVKRKYSCTIRYCNCLNCIYLWQLIAIKSTYNICRTTGLNDCYWVSLYCAAVSYCDNVRCFIACKCYCTCTANCSTITSCICPYSYFCYRRAYICIVVKFTRLNCRHLSCSNYL